jgi:hypothetical protein
VPGLQELAVSVHLLDEALVELWKAQREATDAYHTAMAPAWAVLAAAKAKGDKDHVFDIYHRDFEPVWFAADVAFRAARDAAEQAFRQATGLESWVRFSDEPFDQASTVAKGTPPANHHLS